MTFALAVDDFTTDLESRDTTRTSVLEHIMGTKAKPIDPTDAPPAEAAEFYRRRDAALRDTWGHDPAAQAQWVK